MRAHAVFDVIVAAAVWYWVELQNVIIEQIRSLVDVGAFC